MSNSFRRRFRPRLEQLETREVPAVFMAGTAAELIAHVKAANLTPEADTITLVAGKTYTLTAVDNTTHGATGLPMIAVGENLTILGNGGMIERSSAVKTPAFRLFDVGAGALLTLKNLTLQGGLAYGDFAYDRPAQGGAVYNQGALSLESVTVQGNTAQGADGGTGWGVGTPGASAAGGGVWSNGTLTVVGCTITNNSALGGRGGNGEVSDPFAPGGGRTHRSKGPGGDGGNAFGGGICVAGGSATVRTSALAGNSAQGGQAGSGNNNTPARNGEGRGGAIDIHPAAWLGLDSFTLARFKRNSASTSGADIAGLYDVIG